ncbi:hypothetical protein G9A89_018714 [Geosiphon pyriformis]|nr:hypothetical protein G9A89_018714 [Geosiphon pyriformis]
MSGQQHHLSNSRRKKTNQWTPIEAAWRKTMHRLDSCPHNDNEIWQMALAKIKGASPEEIKTVKNNPPKFIELDWDPESIINLLDSEQFHKNYQELAPTREEQEQWLEQLNTKLCYHCLISSDFEYCNEYDLIYNPPSCIIYMIPEKEESISNCVSESESLFDPNSNFDNDNNKNTSSSSVQYDNNNNDNSNSDSNSNLKYEQYITIPDLTKEQELKWFSDNNKDIMPEHVHDTNTRFDLRYSGKDAIKLEPHLCTYIDLKIVLEILATTMV